jgi:hypothetical protein
MRAARSGGSVEENQDRRFRANGVRDVEHAVSDVTKAQLFVASG